MIQWVLIQRKYVLLRSVLLKMWSLRLYILIAFEYRVCLLLLSNLLFLILKFDFITSNSDGDICTLFLGFVILGLIKIILDNDVWSLLLISLDGFASRRLRLSVMWNLIEMDITSICILATLALSLIHKSYVLP